MRGFGRVRSRDGATGFACRPSAGLSGCGTPTAGRARPVRPGPHSAVPQHVKVVDRVRPGQQARRPRRPPCRRRWATARLTVLRAGRVDRPFSQPHHRDQTGRPDQVRVIENVGQLVDCSHRSDAPSDSSDQILGKANPAVPTGAFACHDPPESLTKSVDPGSGWLNRDRLLASGLWWRLVRSP